MPLGICLYREGINATSVERLANHAAVSKRTLYQHFPSKTILVQEYLRCIQRDAGEPFPLAANPTGHAARAWLLTLFENLSVNGELMRGCPFHNAAVESAGIIPGVEHLVHVHKHNYISAVITMAEQAGAVNPRQPGNQLVLLHEEVAALATSLNDPTPWTYA